MLKHDVQVLNNVLTVSPGNIYSTVSFNYVLLVDEN